MSRSSRQTTCVGEGARPTRSSSLVTDILAFAGFAAGLAKLLGILRWLSAMPTLAVMAAAHDGGSAVVAATAIDACAGAIGELLGVGLLSSIFHLALAYALLRCSLPIRGRKALAVGCLADSFVGMPWSAILHRDLGSLLTVSGAFSTAVGLALAFALLTARR